MRILCSLIISGLMIFAGCSSKDEKKSGGLSKVFKSDKGMPPADLAKLKNVEGLQICANNDYASAIAYFKKAVELDDKPEYYTNLGRCYFWVGRYGDALRCYDETARLGGNDANLQANLGDVFREKQDTTEALKYYHQAVSLDENFARAHYEIGTLLIKSGQYQEAEDRLTRTLEIEPSFSKAMLSRLIVYRMTKQYEKAYKDLRDLDRRGFEVHDDLKHEILAGVKKERNNLSMAEK